MFVQIRDNTLNEISYSDLSYDELTVALIPFDEFSEIYEEMGFDQSTFEYCQIKSFTYQLSPYIANQYSFFIMHIINTNQSFATEAKFAVYLMRQLLLIVDLSPKQPKTKDIFFTMLEHARNHKSPSVCHLFSFYMTYFLQYDNQSLELLERQLEQIEKSVLTSHIDQIRNEIFLYRRKLMILRNYYEQYITISQSLNDNFNQLFSPSDLLHLRQIGSRAKRLCDYSKDLSEYLTQIKESYMAQLDINLNSTMKLFTVITSVFLPLTLIVGWYGMNFNMPEYHWKYGYSFVCVLSILILFVSIYIFKKKGYF